MSLSSNFPTIKPSLNLDFVNVGALDPRITFTRASTATYFNGNGVLTTSAINAARFDYNPTTLEAKGLLIEEQRVNQCIYSQDFTYANWLVTAGTKTTGVADPWGGTTAATITATNTAANLQNAMATVVIGTTYTVSIWMRRRTGTGSVGIRAVENVNTTVAITSTWARYSVTATATQTVGRCGVFVQTIGDEIDVWGAQLEAGAFATSYIPTTTAATTRSADIASIDTLSPWYNSVEMTVYTEYDIIGKTTTSGFATEIDDGTLNNRIINIGQDIGVGDVKLGSFMNSGGSTSVNDYPITAMNVGSVYKLAFAVKSNDAATVANGISVLDATAVIPSGLTTLRLGRRITDRYLNGHLRRIAYYPSRLTNAQLQALTS